MLRNLRKFENALKAASEGKIRFLQVVILGVVVVVISKALCSMRDWYSKNLA